MTQNDQILTYLKAGKRITGLQALRKFGCLHLPRRILDLKEDGHNIVKETIRTESGKRVAEYRLD